LAENVINYLYSIVYKATGNSMNKPVTNLANLNTFISFQVKTKKQKKNMIINLFLGIKLSVTFV